MRIANDNIETSFSSCPPYVFEIMLSGSASTWQAPLLEMIFLYSECLYNTFWDVVNKARLVDVEATSYPRCVFLDIEQQSPPNAVR